MKKFFCILIAVLSVFSLYALSYTTKADVTIFMYHLISDNSREWSDYCISSLTFENDIKTLLSKGYTFITPSELTQPVNTGKYALITFDDGYESNYTKALPILEKHKVPALFFMVSSYIDADGYLSAAQLAELAKNPYITIGAHTDKLHNLSAKETNVLYRSQYMTESIINDISASISSLETVCGKPVRYFSYPYGIYSQQTDILLKKKYNGLITFSTHEVKETLPCKLSAPLGRFNRSLNFQFK